MNRKKKLLLALMNSEGNVSEAQPIDGSIRLMKEVFLAQREANVEIFNFVPYKLGPCSFAVYDEVEELEEMGLVSVEEDQREDDVYKLTPEGKQKAESAEEELERDLVTALRNNKKMLEKMNFGNIISYVYDKYPDMAKNSEVKWMA